MAIKSMMIASSADMRIAGCRPIHMPTTARTQRIAICKKTPRTNNLPDEPIAEPRRGTLGGFVDQRHHVFH
jgi:hypothetical protein